MVMKQWVLHRLQSGIPVSKMAESQISDEHSDRSFTCRNTETIKKLEDFWITVRETVNEVGLV